VNTSIIYIKNMIKNGLPTIKKHNLSQIHLEEITL
jgi:hypothetical protein